MNPGNPAVCLSRNAACATMCLVAFAAASCATAKTFDTKGRIVYARPDHAPIRMTLRVPHGETDALRPAVLLIHGGAWFFGTRHQLHWYGERLAEAGYVTASVTYRMMPAHRFPACADDVKAAVRWLRLHAAEYKIDPGRIAVLGNSAGGHLAALLATTTPEDGLEGDQNLGVSSAVQAAIVMYGVTDVSYYRDPHGVVAMGGLSSAFMKQFVGKRGVHGQDPFEAASPVSYVDTNTCPTLLVHGTQDHLVPYAQSVAYAECLRRLGVPTRMITVPYGHAFDFFHAAARSQVYEAILAFLNAHLSKPAG